MSVPHASPLNCSHAWRWLAAIHVTKNLNGDRATYANAECELCGARDWKHGAAPNTRPVVITPPTT